MGYKDNDGVEEKRVGEFNVNQEKRWGRNIDNLLKEDLKPYVKRGNEDQRGRSGKENDRFNGFWSIFIKLNAYTSSCCPFNLWLLK